MQLLLYAYCTDREATAICKIAWVRTIAQMLDMQSLAKPHPH